MSEDAAVSRAQAAVRDTGWIVESIKNIETVTRGRVRQYSKRSDDGGKSWRVAYDFLYEKKHG